MSAPAQLDPLVNFHNAGGELVRGTILTLQRTQLVMEIYKPNAIGQLSEILNSVTIRIGAIAVYGGRAIVTSLVNTGLTAIACVTLIDPWRELDGVVAAPGTVAGTARAFVQEWTRAFRLRRDYQIVVNEMRAFLSDVARWVDQIDLSDALPRENGQLRDDVFYELATPLMEKTQEFFGALEAEAALVEPELAAAHRAHAQAALHPLLLGAPFVFRTFAKPLGYAGDYQMVNQIVGEQRQGASAYFQMVNVAFLREAVVVAHRNRIEILHRFLENAAESARLAGRPFRILNVGCGPAVEIQRFLQSCPFPDMLEFELVDFNAETLDWTRERLAAIMRQTGRSVRLSLVQNSVQHMLKQRVENSDQPPFDAVYCAGLFDYLSDKVCARLMLHFAARMRAGGTLLVTNVHENNPVRYGMEHLMEWYLIYRDEARLRTLLPPQRSAEQIYVDATGVNVFAQVTLP